MNLTLRRIFIVFAAVVFAVSSALMLRQLFEYRAARQLEDAAREIAAGITLNTELPEVPPALTDVPKTEEAYEEVPQPQPIEEDAAFMLELDMQALKTANSDVIGWIYVPGTAIDYPLVQGSDNSKYLNTAWDGTWNKAGAIFMEERNSAEFDDFNTIIYGHNMGNGSMFSDLHLYRDPEFLPDNNRIYVSNGAVVYRYEIYSAYEARVTEDTYRLLFADETEKQSFIDLGVENSVASAENRPDTDDKILTLSTCPGTGNYSKRWVVHGVLTGEFQPY
ncbi:MAG: class B sortase [Oscillospiraceae bacterium]|nr:class B sortase [Oscillospiraceae bacterium]